MARHAKAPAKAKAAPEKSGAAAANRDRLAQLGAVANRFGAWRPAPEVLREVSVVPTRFIQYDLASGVGGHPLARFTLLHGPSSEGKSEFLLGVGCSFLERGHYFAMIDAERTTPASWVRKLGGEAASSPGFLALPVTTYEQVREEVRRLCDGIAAERARGKLPPDTTALIGVDSIRKLVPKRLWEALSKATAADEDDAKRKGRKAKDGGIDGIGGRAGQIKAALNAAWVDELVPLLADTNTTMIVISRETKDADAGLYDREWKVGGGSALFYDSSLAIRATRTYVTMEVNDKPVTIGEKHRLEIFKTKVSGRRSRTTAGNYYTSNGTLIPAGFDPYRDALELLVGGGIAEAKGGGWLVWQGKRLGQGLHSAVKRLHGDPDLWAAVSADARRFVEEQIRAEEAPR